MTTSEANVSKYYYPGRKRNYNDVGATIKAQYAQNGKPKRAILMVNANGHYRDSSGTQWSSRQAHVWVDIEKSKIHKVAKLKSMADEQFYAPRFYAREAEEIFHKAFSIAFRTPAIKSAKKRKKLKGHKMCSGCDR